MKLFRRSILAVAVLLLLAGSAFGAAYTAVAAGNWSANSTWCNVNWAADTEIALNEMRVAVAVPDNYIYICTARAGDFKTHATTEPVWAGIGVGETIVDDQITWTKLLGSPADGDAVALAAISVAVDIARVPATGRLGTITASGIGGLTCDMTARNYEIYATSITCGPLTTGFILFTGNAAGATGLVDATTLIKGGTGALSSCVKNAGSGGATQIVTVNCPTLEANTGTYSYAVDNAGTARTNITTTTVTATASAYGHALSNSSTGLLYITLTSGGTITGGGTTSVYGVRDSSTGTLTIVGTAPLGGIIKGGAGNNTQGVNKPSTAGSTTFTNINFEDSATGLAYYIYLPPTINNSAVNYHKKGAVYYNYSLTADQIKKDVVNGIVTGTLSPTHGIL